MEEKCRLGLRHHHQEGRVQEPGASRRESKSRVSLQGGPSGHGLSNVVVIVVDLAVKRNFKFNVNIR